MEKNIKQSLFAKNRFKKTAEEIELLRMENRKLWKAHFGMVDALRKISKINDARIGAQIAIDAVEMWSDKNG